MKHLILGLTLSILGYSLAAQSDSNKRDIKRCNSTQALQKRIQKNPQLSYKLGVARTEIQSLKKSRLKSINGEIITIPVVVHVLYRTDQENISDAQIASQLAVLNEDFRRKNSDRDNQWSQADDMQIEFCLANVDPNGNPTTGINRRKTTKRDWDSADEDMKLSNRGGIDSWDIDSYLNIWVCVLDETLGFSTFPGENTALDGIVVTTAAFGSKDKGNGFYLKDYYNLGRTATHEVGHFLGLEHIWGGSNRGCSEDDFIDDTPNAEDANTGANCNSPSSCGSKDMIQNYMDYSDDACMNLFTRGQKQVMRSALLSNRLRLKLANSIKCSGKDPDPVNKRPTIKINKPSNNSTIKKGSSIAIDVTANDQDGKVAKVEFFNNTTKIGQDTSEPYSFTITNAAVGTYKISAKATDDKGATATSSVITVKVEDEDIVVPPPPTGNCTFGTPTTSSLPGFNRASYRTWKILGKGPSFNEVRRFRINYNDQRDALYQFAININKAPYYIDLKSSIDYSFGTARPEVTITNSGVEGFDGSYWVTKDKENLVMVSKTRGFTIYFGAFTNSAACSSDKTREKDNLTAYQLYPNPADNFIQFTTAPQEDSAWVIYNMLGKTMMQGFINENVNGQIDISSLTNGLYFIKVRNGQNDVITHKFMVVH